MLRAHRVFQRNGRSERGQSTTASDQQAAPAPAAPSTPLAAPPTPGHFLSPSQLATLPRMPSLPGSPTMEEWPLQTSRQDNHTGRRTAAGRPQSWTRTPRPSLEQGVAGGAAAAITDAASSAAGRNLAPSETTLRGARRPVTPRRAAAHDAQVVAPPRSLAASREHQRGSSGQSIDDGAQHFIDPAILALVPAELTPNVPQEYAGSPLVSTIRESGERYIGPRQLVPVSREQSGGTSHPLYFESLGSFSNGPAANPAAGSPRQPGLGQQAPQQWISTGGSRLLQDSAFPIDNTTSIANQSSLVRMPFASSSSADATRSGDSEGWVTISNLSQQGETPAHPAITGRMHNGRLQARDAGLLAPSSSRPRSNPFLAPRTYDDAASSPYASPVYQHPSPMPTDHRHPFASTPPRLPQLPERPQTRISRTDVRRSPGLSDTGSASTARQPAQTWIRPSTVALERSSELEDGNSIPSTPARSRAQRYGVTTEQSWDGLTSPTTPSGAASSPSSAGPWVSYYDLRRPPEIPSRLDAVSEASSTTERGFAGEGRSQFDSSTTGLVLSRQQHPQRDSWWSYGSSEDRSASPGQETGAPAQVEGSSLSVEVSAPSPSLPRVERFPLQRQADVQHQTNLQHRVNLQRQANHQPQRCNSPTLRTETATERPTPRDMRGLRHYLDARQFSSTGEQVNNTVAAMLPPNGSLRIGQAVPVEWTNIPLTDPPVLRAPLHSQPLAPPAIARQRRISLYCLALCHLFPPLLFLYAAGRLDWVMNWWTSGEIPCMRRDHKRLALPLGFAVCGGILLVIVIALLAVYARH